MNDMKRILLVLFIIAFSGITNCCDCNSNNNNGCNDCCSSDDDCCSGCEGGHYTSKTYFRTVNAFESGTYLNESLFCNDRMTARDTEDGCGWGGAVELVAFGGKTTGKGSRDLGEWFAINHNNSMIATNQIVLNGLGLMAGDIDVNHFNVVLANDAAFTSTISFCPVQKYAGLGIDWMQVLCRNDDDTRRWFFELSGPVEWIKNEMRLKENITQGEGIAAFTGNGLDGTPYVNSMTAAFKQAGWKYGKILNGCTNQTAAATTTTTTTGCGCNNDCNDCNDCSCDCDHKVRFAELEVKLGWNGVLSDCCAIDATIGLICPTGNKNNPDIVFAPVVGNGKHWGISWGAEMQYNIWTWDEAALKVRIDTDARYLFKNDQMRSFDLVGKPWSRYMMMFANQDDAIAFSTGTLTDSTGTSGINLMTRCVDVTPGYQFNMNTGFVYKGECFIGELGTTLYARHGEKICPNWTEGPVLKSTAVAGTPTAPSLTITHARTMEERATLLNLPPATLYDAVKITTCDVDWSSAAMPGFTAHSVYGTLGYNWGEACYPTFISVGGAYDFSQGNVALKRWTVFGKLGVSF